MGGERNGFSDVGISTVLPIFLTHSEEQPLPDGFYMGPVLGFGRNFISDHFTATVAVGDGPIGIDVKQDGDQVRIISTGFFDHTVTITWNGIDCEITTTPQRADK